MYGFKCFIVHYVHLHVDLGGHTPGSVAKPAKSPRAAGWPKWVGVRFDVKDAA